MVNPLLGPEDEVMLHLVNEDLYFIYHLVRTTVTTPSASTALLLSTDAADESKRSPPTHPQVVMGESC